ncbi:unnamed protein product, partial [Laminaria digitata]
LCPPEGDSGERNPYCVKTAEDMQPRLHLTSLSPGDVSASLQVGAARAEIARLELFQAHLAIEIDIGAAKTGMETLASTLPDVPEDVLAALRAANVQGRLRAEVGPNAASLYAARLIVLSRVVIETSVEGEAIALHLEASDPAVEITVDPSTQTVTAELNTGGMDLTAPFNLFGGVEGPAPCTVGPNGETNCDDPVEPEPLMGSLQLIAPASTARVIMTGSDRIIVDNI